VNIVFHVFGVLVLIQIISYFVAGEARTEKSRATLIIAVPAAIVYIAWLAISNI
jgi:hypothetical protein